MFSKALSSARRSRKSQEAEASRAELLRTLVHQAEQGQTDAWQQLGLEFSAGSNLIWGSSGDGRTGKLYDTMVAAVVPQSLGTIAAASAVASALGFAAGVSAASASSGLCSWSTAPWRWRRWGGEPMRPPGDPRVSGGCSCWWPCWSSPWSPRGSSRTTRATRGSLRTRRR